MMTRSQKEEMLQQVLRESRIDYDHRTKSIDILESVAGVLIGIGPPRAEGLNLVGEPTVDFMFEGSPGLSG